MRKTYTKTADIFFINIRDNNGVKERRCTKCQEWKPETTEYFYMKNKSKPEKGFNSECKECAKKRSLKNRNENIERARASYCDWYWRDQNAKKVKKNSKKYYSADPQKKLLVAKEFRESHPEIIKGYNNKRQHKNHNINNVEWIACKDYFKNENGEWACAYCGRTEEESYKLYNCQLHKEHAIFDGANDLSNCVPACQECNSEKYKDNFDEWYNKQNIKYDEKRYDKIVNWLYEDYKKFIMVKKPRKKYTRKNTMDEVG